MNRLACDERFDWPFLPTDRALSFVQSSDGMKRQYGGVSDGVVVRVRLNTEALDPVRLFRDREDLLAGGVVQLVPRLDLYEDRACIASGGVVPAFSGKTLVAPPAMTVTAPSCANGMCGIVSRTSPFTATWTGSGSGSVIVGISTSGSGVTGSASCTFDVSTGTGTIPAALMSDLVAGTGIVTVNSSNTTNFNAGDYAVRFQAFSTPVRGQATIH